jgi:hypothetical protein
MAGVEQQQDPPVLGDGADLFGKIAGRDRAARGPVQRSGVEIIGDKIELAVDHLAVARYENDRNVLVGVLLHGLRDRIERVEDGGAARLIVRQICFADVGVEAWLAGRVLLALEQRGRHVAGVLGGIIEMQAARLVAETIDADRQHMQDPAGRFGAAGRPLDRKSVGVDFREAKGPRGFAFIEDAWQRVRLVKS